MSNKHFVGVINNEDYEHINVVVTGGTTGVNLTPDDLQEEGKLYGELRVILRKIDEFNGRHL